MIINEVNGEWKWGTCKFFQPDLLRTRWKIEFSRRSEYYWRYIRSSRFEKLWVGRQFPFSSFEFTTLSLTYNNFMGKYMKFHTWLIYKISIYTLIIQLEMSQFSKNVLKTLTGASGSMKIVQQVNLWVAWERCSLQHS